jgi:hypothetical protein
MSKFWQQWLSVWCALTVLFGAVLVAGAFEATSGPTRFLYALMNGPEPFRLDPLMRFSIGVLGAVTIGWGITLLGAMQAAAKLGGFGRPLWIVTATGIASWYVIDSTLSCVTGYSVNAAFNTVFVAAFLVPMIASGVLKRVQ